MIRILVVDDEADVEALITQKFDEKYIARNGGLPLAVTVRKLWKYLPVRRISILFSPISICPRWMD